MVQLPNHVRRHVTGTTGFPGIGEVIRTYMQVVGMTGTGHGHVSHLYVLLDRIPIEYTVVFPDGLALCEVTRRTEARDKVECEIVERETQWFIIRVGIGLVGFYQIHQIISLSVSGTSQLTALLLSLKNIHPLHRHSVLLLVDLLEYRPPIVHHIALLAFALQCVATDNLHALRIHEVLQVVCIPTLAS